MSTGPMCKVCHTSHWTREPHAFGIEPEDSKKKQRKAYMRDLATKLDSPLVTKEKVRATNKRNGHRVTGVTATNTVHVRPDMSRPATNRYTATPLATNAATNPVAGPDASEVSATNRTIRTDIRTLNRRDRSDYNTYQRECMRKRRTVKKVTTAIIGKKNG